VLNKQARAWCCAGLYKQTRIRWLGRVLYGGGAVPNKQAKVWCLVLGVGAKLTSKGLAWFGAMQTRISKGLVLGVVLYVGAKQGC